MKASIQEREKGNQQDKNNSNGLGRAKKTAKK